MTILIKKVDNGIRQSDFPIQFPYDKIQYFEIIENKEKVKANLIKKDYVGNNGNNTNYSDNYGGDYDDHYTNDYTNNDDNYDEKYESDDDKLDSRMQDLLEDGGDRGDGGHSTRSFSVGRQHTLKTPIPLSRRHDIHIQGNHQNLDQIDYSNEDDEEAKRHLIFQFDNLKKKYSKYLPNNIPEFSMHSDLRLMQSTYDQVQKQIFMEKNIKEYKYYLLILFQGIEFAGSNYLNYDMQGYVASQNAKMDDYDALLIEIGEKHDISFGKDLPVEARLLLAILLNTVTFVITKEFAKKGHTFFQDQTPMPPPNMTGIDDIPDDDDMPELDD